MDGHDQRSPAAGDGHGRGVHQVDGAGGPLDTGPAEGVPRLVQRQPGQRQVPDGTGGAHGSGGGPSCRAATPTTSTSSRSARAPARARIDVAVPPGTRCQHCSRVSATRSRPVTAEGDGAVLMVAGSIADRVRTPPHPLLPAPRSVKVLVTGSAGLIGSEAVEFFDGLGFAVDGIDNNTRADFFGPGGDTTWNRQRLEATCAAVHAPRHRHPRPRGHRRPSSAAAPTSW